MVLFSDIYNCLRKFSPDKFEVAMVTEEVSQSTKNQQISMADCQLAQDVIEDLTIAAELNRMSYLKEAIDTLANDPSIQQGLAEHLLKYVDNYDMDGLIEALKEIKHV